MLVVKLLSPEGISVGSNTGTVLDMVCESIDDSFQHDDSVTEDNDYIISTNESQVRWVSVQCAQCATGMFILKVIHNL